MGGSARIHDARYATHRAERAVRLAMLLGFVAGCVNMAHRTGFGVVYPAMVGAQGWSVGEVTGAFSVAMLCYAPLVVVIGQLVDRLGVRGTMLLGTLVFGAGMAGVSAAREAWQLYPAYIVAVGFGASAMGFVPTLKLLSLRAGRRIPLAIGLFNAGQGVGSLIAAPALQLTIEAGGWRLAALVLGLSPILLLAPLAWLAAPTRSEGRSSAPADHASVAGIWREPAFWLAMLANAGLGYLLLLPTHQVAHLVHVGVPALLAATIGGLMGGCIGLGALVSGMAADRLGPGRLGPIGVSTLTVGVLSLLSSGPTSVWLAAVYVVAGGLGRGMLGVNSAAFQARYFAGPSLGRITGLIDLGFGLGAFAGPYLTGLSYDRLGTYGPGLASGIGAAVATTIATMFAFRLGGHPRGSYAERRGSDGSWPR